MERRLPAGINIEENEIEYPAIKPNLKSLIYDNYKNQLLLKTFPRRFEFPRRVSEALKA